jgi:hypothetical protein
MSDREDMVARAQAFVDRKYVTRADERQKAMGLAYIEAERQDLAREMTRFAISEASLRSAARTGPDVAVKPLEWRGPISSYPTTIWEAKTSFGHYVIEEVSASDSPAYEVRLSGVFVKVKDCVDDAKAAAQADFEHRIRSAIAALPAPDTASAGWRPIETAPKDGGYIVTNRKQQVAFCDMQSGLRIIHNVTGFVEWDFGEPATRWQPLPAAPTITRKSEERV